MEGHILEYPSLGGSEGQSPSPENINICLIEGGGLANTE